jgi:hypothetical protein
MRPRSGSPGPHGPRMRRYAPLGGAGRRAHGARIPASGAAAAPARVRRRPCPHNVVVRISANITSKDARVNILLLRVAIGAIISRGFRPAGSGRPLGRLRPDQQEPPGTAGVRPVFGYPDTGRPCVSCARRSDDANGTRLGAKPDWAEICEHFASRLLGLIPRRSIKDPHASRCRHLRSSTRRRISKPPEEIAVETARHLRPGHGTRPGSWPWADPSHQVGRMFLSKIDVGMARVQQALGTSTMPLIRPSHGQQLSRRYACSPV